MRGGPDTVNEDRGASRHALDRGAAGGMIPAVLSPLQLRRGALEAPALGAVSGLVHGFTTRALGSARRPGDDGPDAVSRAVAGQEGWRRLEVRQVHGDRAVLAEELGSGPVDADAIASGRPGDLLVVRTADCLAVLVVAESEGRARAVAAVHAGWRGLLAGVVEAAVRRLSDLAPEATLRAAAGPAIGPCCFEVGPDVARPWADRFGDATVRRGPRDRSHVDLAGALAVALLSTPARLVTPPPPCTRCRPEDFHSHRAHGDAAGRMAAFIGLEPRAA